MKRKTLLKRLDSLIFSNSHSSLLSDKRECLEYCKKLVEKHRRATKHIAKLMKIIDEGKSCDNCVFCDLDLEQQPCYDCIANKEAHEKWRLKL